MSYAKDSTRISAILNEIKKSEQESMQMRGGGGNPRLGIPLPQPVIPTANIGANLAPIQEQPAKIVVQKSFNQSFKVYLKQGILFFFLFFLCSNNAFRSGFLEIFSSFATTGGQVSTMGQIILSLMATIGFILLQIIF